MKLQPRMSTRRLMQVLIIAHIGYLVFTVSAIVLAVRT